MGLLVLGLGRAAPAAPKDLFEQLYEAAKADIAAKRFALALEKCQEGLKMADVPLERRWSFLVGAALSSEGLGRPLDALEYFHRLLADIGARPKNVTEVWRKRQEDIGAFVKRAEGEVLGERGAVVVTSAPAGARVYVDGVPYGPDGEARTPTTLYLAAGEHALRLELEGYGRAEVPLTATPGEREKALVPLVASKPPASVVEKRPDPVVAADPLERRIEEKKAPVVLVTPLEPKPAEVSTPSPLPGSGEVATAGAGAPMPWYRPVWGWVTLGAGVALAAAGVPFTLLAKGEADKLADLDGEPSTDENRAAWSSAEDGLNRNQTLAGVLYGVGAAAVVGGVVWIVVEQLGGDGGRTSEREPSVWVGATPLGKGAGVTLGGRW